MKLLQTMAIVLVTTLAINSSASAAIYKLAANVSEDNGAGILLQKAADEIKSKTDGEVRIKIFYDGQLGSQMEYMQQLQRGVVDIGLVGSSTMENILPVMEVINLPYLYRSLDEYEKVVLNKDVQAELFKDAESKGFAPLGVFNSGVRNIYATRPIESIEDLQGMKLRTMESETYIEMIRLFGATPTPLDYSEVYSALEQGVIDGAEGGLASLSVNNFGEVAKYAVRSEQTRLTDFVVMSSRFMDKLSGQNLKIVKDIFDEMGQYSMAYIDDSKKEPIQHAIDEMDVSVSNIDKAPFIKAVQPLYAKASQDETKRKVLDMISNIEDRELSGEAK